MGGGSLFIWKDQSCNGGGGGAGGGARRQFAPWMSAAKGGLFLLVSVRLVDSHGAPSKHGGAEGTSGNEEVP